MRRSLLALPLALGLFPAFVGACSSDDGGSSTGTSSGAATTCSADQRKDVYTPGLTKAAGDLTIAMVDSAFTPTGKPVQSGEVQKGMNSITVQVLDAAKAPVEGATVKLNLWMPDHQHGSARAPVVTAQGGGKYQITEVWLPMAGLWRFTIEVQQNGTPKTADFNFCLEG